MTELLAPAGNKEAFIAAIANGCDAVYLGMKKFGARAYSANFDGDTLREVIDYAHLRNVRVYVTMNTIIFQDEIDEMGEQMKTINAAGVDGIIVQDLAALHYVVNHLPDVEAHCSTQMGIDDLDGVRLVEMLGAKRVVMAREASIDDLRAIKKQSDLPLEVFVHGALCVSYSGNCLMSGLIGYRSGNRGRCVGSCRKPYQLVDGASGQVLADNYILSPKDLNTIERIDALKVFDSLKIEGRMKEAAYVANVVGHYRKALDGHYNKSDAINLKKTFNRTFSKGYLFAEDSKSLINAERPNNYGYQIGRVAGRVKGMYQLNLTQPLHQNDIIRIDHSGEDVVLTVVKLYNGAGELINRADDVCYIKIKESLSENDRVYITKQRAYYQQLAASSKQEYRRFPLDIKVTAKAAAKLIIEAEGLGFTYRYQSEQLLEKAVKAPLTKAQLIKQFSKLNDTVFKLNRVLLAPSDGFVAVKQLNAARRQIVEALYRLKLSSKQRRVKKTQPEPKISFATVQPYLTAVVTSAQQYAVCRQNGLTEIYFDNIIRRNQNHYRPRQGTLLIGGYGGINHYRLTNPFVTDYSLNVVNARSCFELYKLGAKRVTLSYELNRHQISHLIAAYRQQYGDHPALELIVYGRAPLMVTKYCPLKGKISCAECRTRRFYLRDERDEFPILSQEDCQTTVLNGRTLNLLDELPSIAGVDTFRLNFTTESADEVSRVISQAKAKLNGDLLSTVFDPQKDTRGHFTKEIL